MHSRNAAWWRLSWMCFPCSDSGASTMEISTAQTNSSPASIHSSILSSSLSSLLPNSHNYSFSPGSDSRTNANHNSDSARIFPPNTESLNYSNQKSCSSPPMSGSTLTLLSSGTSGPPHTVITSLANGSSSYVRSPQMVIGSPRLSSPLQNNGFQDVQNSPLSLLHNSQSVSSPNSSAAVISFKSTPVSNFNNCEQFRKDIPMDCNNTLSLISDHSSSISSRNNDAHESFSNPPTPTTHSSIFAKTVSATYG